MTRALTMGVIARDAAGVTLWTVAPRAIWLRRDLVAMVDSALARAGYSGRARRQVDLARVWSVAQSGKAPYWTIHASESVGLVARLDFAP